MKKTTHLTISREVQVRLKELKPEKMTWDVFLMEMANEYNKPKSDRIELNQKEQGEVHKALFNGANLDEMLRSGLVWAARSHNSRKRKIDVDLSDLSDEELEFMEVGKAKLIPGLGDEKAHRTLQQIKDWNERQVEKSRQIAVSATYLFKLRKELGELTGGKISQINRPSVNKICPKSVANDYNLYKGLVPSHNRKIPAISLGVQAYQSLIEKVIDPSYELVYRDHLNS